MGTRSVLLVLELPGHRRLSLRVREERENAVTPRFHEELLEELDARGLVFLQRVESLVLAHLDCLLQPVHRHEMLRPREIDLNQAEVAPNLKCEPGTPGIQFCDLRRAYQNVKDLASGRALAT